MAILRKILIYILPFMMTGCYEDFTPDIDVTPVLCINSMITAGEPVEVDVSRTWLYTDVQSEADHSVKDATVSVYANGELVDGDYLPREGDCIRIVADSPTYGHAEGEVTVPHAVSVRISRWIPDHITYTPETYAPEEVDGYEMIGFLSFDLSVELEITDDPADENYFRLSFDSFFPKQIVYDDGILAENTSWCVFSVWSYDYQDEPIFKEHIGILESVMGADSYGFTFFTDRQFAGSTYPLHLRYQNCSYYVRSPKWNPELLDCGLNLTLQTVSQSCYNWANYLWQREDGLYADLGDIGMSDPMHGYSNVSTGAGIIAARAITTCTINFADFLATELHKATSDS